MCAARYRLIPSELDNIIKNKESDIGSQFTTMGATIDNMKRVAREDHMDQDLLSKAKSQIKGSTLKNTPFPKPIKRFGR